MKTPVYKYDVHVEREFVATMGGVNLDALPCRVIVSADFMNGKDAVEFECRIRRELEALACGSVDSAPSPTAGQRRGDADGPSGDR